MTHSVLVPLPVAVPLLAAALLAGTQALRRRLLAEAIALLAAGGVTVICGWLLALTIHHGRLVYWFGGWRPRGGVALGIDFAVDPYGAGLATFSGLLVVAALISSWRYFESVGHAFPALMLVFLAALVGFCLSGDVFDMFVFFELLTVVGMALTAYRADQRAPLQGALNFGICNAIGGFLVLFGIALLYGRTGALNLAQIAVALAHHRPDGLVLVAFGLITAGFFVKAAIVPFHFWLADAYASAPTPVCIVFAGVMSEMGLYGVARVYETVFAGPLGPHAAMLRLILVIAGAATALFGAVMTALQHLLKRMLAFATVSSMGMFLIGFGMLDARGLAGAAVLVVGDGLTKASLFVCVGILQHRRSDDAPIRIRGLGRGLPFTGAVYVVGALCLAATPGCGSFIGRSLIESAASGYPGFGWVPVVLAATEILVGASVLASAGRAFLGWGPDLPGDATGERETDADEMGGPARRTPAVLFGPAILLMLASVAIGVVPGVGRLALDGAARFADRAGYVTVVLGGRVPSLRLPSAPSPSLEEIGLGLAFTAATCALATALLVHRRWPRALPGDGAWRGIVDRLRLVHSGHPGDEVTWLIAGAATLCLVLATGLR